MLSGDPWIVDLSSHLPTSSYLTFDFYAYYQPILLPTWRVAAWQGQRQDWANPPPLLCEGILHGSGEMGVVSSSLYFSTFTVFLLLSQRGMFVGVLRRKWAKYRLGRRLSSAQRNRLASDASDLQWKVVINGFQKTVKLLYGVPCTNNNYTVKEGGCT